MLNREICDERGLELDLTNQIAVLNEKLNMTKSRLEKVFLG